MTAYQGNQNRRSVLKLLLSSLGMTAISCMEHTAKAANIFPGTFLQELNSKQCVYDKTSYTIGDTETLEAFLSRETKAKRGYFVGEEWKETKEKRSLKEWLSMGVIPDIHYDLSYSDWKGNATKMFAIPLVGNPFGSSGISIDLRPGRHGLPVGRFSIETAKPDYTFRQEDRDGVLKRKEELDDKTFEYCITDHVVDWDSGALVSERVDTGVMSKVQDLYRGFGLLLGGQEQVALPVQVGNTERRVDIGVRCLDQSWYALCTRFEHDASSNKDAMHIDKVDLLVYRPPRSDVGLPYKGEIKTSNNLFIYVKLDT